MKETGNSQPPTAEPSKKKKRRRTSTHYTDKKRIRPFHLAPIVEEADGSKAQSMAEVDELGNDSIEEDSQEETNS
jgi:hypothetical protein